MREEKRWLRHENGLSHFFFWLRHLLSNPKAKARQNALRPPKMTANNSENIRESILDFTAHFGEINPDMPYLCRRGSSGPERPFLPLFPL